MCCPSLTHSLNPSHHLLPNTTNPGTHTQPHSPRFLEPVSPGEDGEEESLDLLLTNLEVDLVQKLRQRVSQLAATAWQHSNLPVPQVRMCVGGPSSWQHVASAPCRPRTACQVEVDLQDNVHMQTPLLLTCC